MEFEKVLKGIIKYLDSEIYSGMNDWQEVLARIAVSRIVGNSENLKYALANNAYIKTFGIMDESGMIDVEGLINDLKTQISQKEKLTISLPMFGKFTFTVSDVDKLHSIIMEG